MFSFGYWMSDMCVLHEEKGGVMKKNNGRWKKKL